MPATDPFHAAYLALGANLGDRRENLRTALERLTHTGDIQCASVSSLYETEPVGGPSQQGDYLNAVVEVRTSLDARALLRRCHDVEFQAGRHRSIANAPRPIDLDILLFDDAVIDEVDLKIPHPRLHERRFVLEPLVEIAPGVNHPQMGTNMRTLLAQLPTGNLRICRVAPPDWGVTDTPSAPSPSSSAISKF